MRKLTLVAALVAGTFAAFGGAKQIGYVGASSGIKPNALKIVEVDADTGEIATLGSLPIANATYIAVNRARTRLYTSLADPKGEKGKNGGVAVYALDPTGTAPAHLATLMTGHPAPCHLSLSPDEKKLVFAEYGRGTAGWVNLKTDGTFAKETLQGIVSEDPTGPNKPRQDRPHCHCARVTPDGKYVCIVDLGTDRVKIYSTATDAFVRDLVTTPAGAGPRHIAFHPNGRFAYLLFELENYVTSYRYEDGTFTRASPTSRRRRRSSSLPTVRSSTARTAGTSPSPCSPSTPRPARLRGAASSSSTAPSRGTSSSCRAAKCSPSGSRRTACCARIATTRPPARSRPSPTRRTSARSSARPSSLSPPETETGIPPPSAKYPETFQRVHVVALRYADMEIP